MSYWIYKIRFQQFFLNGDGIKLFADRCINKYVSKAAVKRANVLTTYVTVFKEERKKRAEELLLCKELDRMDAGSFALKSKKSKNMKIVVYITILFEIFLNYISTLIFIQGDGLLYVLVRWGLSIILALAATLVTDGILIKLLPEDSVTIRGIGNVDNYERNAKAKRVIGLILLPLLLLAVEIAIIGVSKARALDFEGGKSGDILFYGFILLSMALPIIAGYFKWDSEQHGKIYQNTLNYNKTEKLLHILNLQILRSMKDIKAVVEGSIRVSWEVFSQFKLYKENFNIKKGIPKEDISKHYSKNPESFNEEVLKCYGYEVIYILKELEKK